MEKVSLSSREGLNTLDKTTSTEKKNDSKASSAAAKEGEAPKQSDLPAYVVAFTAQKTENKSTYSPQEVRAKARSLMLTGNLPKEQQEVLESILSKEDGAAKAKES